MGFSTRGKSCASADTIIVITTEGNIFKIDIRFNLVNWKSIWWIHQLLNIFALQPTFFQINNMNKLLDHLFLMGKYKSVFLLTF